MGIRPTLALIAEESCPIDTSIGDVVRFSPLPGISEALQAKVVRLLLPALFPDDVCIISDIDMLPISSMYFHDGASCCPEDGFLVYRDGVPELNGTRYPMCYVAAKGKVFSSIFGVSHSGMIPKIIQQWANIGYGWNTDELLLYSYARVWESRGGHVVRLGHETKGRLDRGSWYADFDQIDFSNYIDCHCPRPYSAYQESIDQVVEGIWEQLRNQN